MSDSMVNEWKPNEEYLNVLVGMGIPYAAAEEALYCTDNRSLEEATNYVFDHPESEEPLFSADNSVRKRYLQQRHVRQEKNNESEGKGINCKMVFIVNTALGMGVGKVAAQVAHACLGVYREILESDNDNSEINTWENEGEKKVVLKGENHTHLEELHKQANEEKLFSYLVHDAGRTQIPANSITVLGIFGCEENVNKITGHLSLL